MEIAIQIDQSFAEMVQPNLIEEAVLLTFQLSSQHPTKSVSIVITDDKTVRALNHQYRGLDVPTDVLSFENEPDPDFPGAAVHLGDIVIAYPTAQAQALAAGHTPMQEVLLLTVHGLLHLLGFDHDSAASKAEMWAGQQKIMTALGLGHVQPTET